eukprot:4466649-Prymnesium_polylepis.1
MLIALFPVNLGDEEPNSEGESFIASAVSCDGVRWSETPTPFGRTWDHPVDGIVTAGGAVYFFLNLDVERISENDGDARIQQYRFNTAALQAQVQRARQGWGAGCRAPPRGSCEVHAASENGDALDEGNGWDFFVKLDCLQQNL